MSGATVAVLEVLLARMRAETGGSFATFLLPDQRPLAIDAASGALESDGWSGVLTQVSARWPLWCKLGRTDPWLSAAGSHVLAFWLPPHGVVLVDVERERSFGLLRLLLEPLLNEIRRVLNGGTPSAGGQGTDARPLH